MKFNQEKQYTLKQPVTLKGKGLHTGVAATLHLLPAEVDYGFQFQRMDLEGQPVLKALAEYVLETPRSTKLVQGNVSVQTPEHLLGALSGMGITNCLIQIEGPEVPILDGSALAFVQAIKEAGITEQEGARVWYALEAPIVIEDKESDVEILAFPAEEYSITCLADFNSSVLGLQYAQWTYGSSFETEIAPCRTFCLFKDIETLYHNGLIKGADVNNALVVVDEPIPEQKQRELSALLGVPLAGLSLDKPGYLNPEGVRFSNEIARHKILDLLGDFALTGFSVRAKIVARKMGHKHNNLMARQLREWVKNKKSRLDVPVYDAAKPPVFTINDLIRKLPHKHPFLLVDKIIEMTEDTIVGVKNVTFDEYFFQGHFPDNPVMPGVLQIEALAQTGGVLLLSGVADPHNYDTYFLKIDNCRFKQKILPGDTMILKTRLIEPARRGISSMVGSIYVGGKLCTEAQLVAQVIKMRND